MRQTIRPGLLTRRQVLKQAILSLPLLVSFSPLVTMAMPLSRRLSFYHIHTGEHLVITYAKNNRYLPAALNKINHYLRDFRTGEIHPIDPLLLDMLYDLQKATGNSTGVFAVISGYRSPEINKKLNGARHSLHMSGRAIDIRLSGTKTSHLRDTSLAMQRGGTGYYAKSDFIHIDTGRVRWW